MYNHNCLGNYYLFMLNKYLLFLTYNKIQMLIHANFRLAKNIAYLTYLAQFPLLLVCMYLCICFVSQPTVFVYSLKLILCKYMYIRTYIHCISILFALIFSFFFHISFFLVPPLFYVFVG